MIQRREKGASELNRAGEKKTDRRDEDKGRQKIQERIQIMKRIEADFGQMESNHQFVANLFTEDLSF